MGERWPSVYDVESLKATIQEAALRARSGGFWDPEASGRGDAWAQGDLVELATDIPMLDEEGQPFAAERSPDEPWWLLLGNSCDLTRTLAESPFSVLVPVHRHPEDVEQRRRFEAQPFSRRIWVPNWQGSPEGLFSCDLTRPVTIDRRCLSHGPARRLARCSRAGWVLLHACLVRFLARDDGRFDG